MGYKEILKSTEALRRAASAEGEEKSNGVNNSARPEAGREEFQTSEPVNAAQNEPATAYSPAIELDLVLRNGDHWGFPYSYKPAMHFDRSEGITIYYSSHKVTIKGRNLLPIYKALVAHNAREIREQDTEFDDLPERATVVTSIRIEEC